MAISKSCIGFEMTFWYWCLCLLLVFGESQTSTAAILTQNTKLQYIEWKKLDIGNFIWKGCNPDFCCNFDVHTSFNRSLVNETSQDYYRYFLLMFKSSSRVKSPSGLFTTEYCGIVACTNNSETSCVGKYNHSTPIIHPTTFSLINISRTFNETEIISFSPVLLTCHNKTDYSPQLKKLPNSSYSYDPSPKAEFSYNLDTHVGSYSMLEKEDALGVFAFYKSKGNSCSVNKYALLAVLFAMTKLLIYY